MKALTGGISIMCLWLMIAFTGSSAFSLVLDDPDVTELNRVMNKTFSKEEWEGLKRLSLDRLPEEQFPASFDKLSEIEIIDLLPTATFADCRETSLKKSIFETRQETNEKLLNYFRNREICLSGRIFVLSDRLGAGDQAVVYKITDKFGNDYAFTRYNSNLTTEWRGNILVLSKARKSLPVINIPLLINKSENYKISAIMSGGTAQLDSHAKFRTNGDCELLIRQDGIFSGWDAHEKNYMYDYDMVKSKMTLKAIDFRTWIPLEKATASMLNPRYGQRMGDAEKCLNKD